jgi:hypothetical protein
MTIFCDSARNGERSGDLELTGRCGAALVGDLVLYPEQLVVRLLRVHPYAASAWRP